MLTYGFEGAIRIASAAPSASSTPGAACGSPSKRTPSTSSRWPRATNHSWNGKLPAGVSIQVRRRSSVAGRIAGSIPSARASRAVTADKGSPSRSACVRTRWRPRSRSPSRNQSSPPRARDGRERLPRLAGPAPAALLVVEACERVEDAVEVGRDRHPEHLEVVADVADDRQIRAARPHRRGRGRSARRRRPRRGGRPSPAAARGRSRPASSGRPAGRSGPDRRACRRRRSDSGSRRRSPARRGCRRGRGSGRRCRRRRAARSAPSPAAPARSWSRPRPRRSRSRRARPRRRACAGRGGRRRARRR